MLSVVNQSKHFYLLDLKEPCNYNAYNLNSHNAWIRKMVSYLEEDIQAEST